ncbi:MAG: type II CAAX endopeptidase family protein [Pleurocapsa sp.]
MFPTSLLKVMAFLGVWAIIWLPIAFFVARLINWQPNKPLVPQQKLILLASLYILIPPIMWWKIHQEGLSFAAIGWQWQFNLLLSLGLGLFIAVVGLILVFSLESWLGLITWQWSQSKVLLTSICPIFLLSLAIGGIEELIFRGYIFSVLTVDYSLGLAAIASSIIFALLHLIWERKETIPQIPGLWLMGMILVGARLADNGSLGLAWGLHAGWIWGLSCLDTAELITYTDNSKNWLIGINQQPLAGVAGILCLLFTGVVLWWLSPALTYL